jgi:arylsulfatase A-like enzyme
MVLMGAALGITVVTKLRAVRGVGAKQPLVALLDVTSSDVMFVGAAVAVLALLYGYAPVKWASRGALAGSGLVLGWAAANGVWLWTTGSQIQPGILVALSRDPLHFWPIARGHVARHPGVAGLGFVIGLIVLLWFVWRMIRPAAVDRVRGFHVRRGAVGGAAFLAAWLVGSVSQSYSRLGMDSGALGFSSHWYALLSTAALTRDEAVETREIPKAGERAIGLPARSSREMPNVVMVLLESVSYRVTSLSGEGLETTPTLSRMAQEGVEFESTHLCIPQTSKAFWSVLTGSRPDVQGDYAEAILADEPYESLASILRRKGYRSGFFQMCKGTFECAPGMFSNLGFDWAWFRENLEDPSAHLGYLQGDDMRMIDPMMEWVDKGREPFFLMMISSVAHVPFELPKGYAEPKEDPYQRYLQTVEYTDDFIKGVEAALGERGLNANTLWCVIGDHGESFRNVGRKSRWRPLEELIRVPWVMKWDGHLSGGQKVTWPCAQMDVTPTILSVLGFDISKADFEGKDALTPSAADRRLYFSSWFENSPRGYISGNKKYMYQPYVNQVGVYDLAADPKEQSPTEVTGAEKAAVIADVTAWQNESHIHIPAKRFEERMLFDHWRTFTSGRSGWAYYVP